METLKYWMERKIWPKTQVKVAAQDALEHVLKFARQNAKTAYARDYMKQEEVVILSDLENYILGTKEQK